MNTQGLAANRIDSLAPVAGARPSGDGRLRLEGLAPMTDMMTLDEAWAAAGAALPEGRWVLSLTRPDLVDVIGWNARAFDRDGGYDLRGRRRAFDEPDGRRARHAWRQVENSERDYTVYGSTAAAALLALAAVLVAIEEASR